MVLQRQFTSMILKTIPRHISRGRVPTSVQLWYFSRSLDINQLTFQNRRSYSDSRTRSASHSSNSQTGTIGESSSFSKDQRSDNTWAKIVGVGAAGVLTYYLLNDKNRHVQSQAAGAQTQSSITLSHLPVYRSADVAEHYNAEKRIWVSFKNGVYDVTEFVAKHPGGNRIMMAAGGSLEPFWELYPVHQRPDVFNILEKYRIGNLAEDDIVQVESSQDAFANDPRRHPCLVPRLKKPFNGETPPAILTEQFYTPNDLFYVRNHLPVPEVDMKTYTLEIEGINIRKEKILTYEEIKKFPKVEISAAIQCGGNRRSDMGKTKDVAGLAWTGGAIGNAKWGGASLRDVLKSAGFNAEKYTNPEKIHVQFEGMDSDQSGECYGASVPLSYILDGNFNAVLAYEMNDKTLPLDHGFPVRVILPGIVGARSVKWLSRIIISDQESQSPWQQRDYKVFSPSVTMDTVDFSAAPAIMDTPVTSYICSHENGQAIKSGATKVQGYAYSGGGRKIVRVEISRDKGATWEIANITHSTTKEARNWSWVLWDKNLNLAKGQHEIWVKAVDSGYNQQPEDFRSIWNYRGLLATAYHKINVNAT